MTDELRCEYCHTEHSNASAFLACLEECERESRNTRQWFSNFNPHRRD